MRSPLILLIALLATTISIHSCFYEYPPLAAPIEPEDVSFNTHIVPILETHCAKSECHDGKAKPDLRPENAYRSLKSGGYYNVTFPTSSSLYEAINYSGGLPMPPDGQLSRLDRELILIWITKGAPND